ncbi:hypothetical protein NBRC116597_11370 [Phaeobacter sp. NW0010-22]
MRGYRISQASDTGVSRGLKTELSTKQFDRERIVLPVDAGDLAVGLPYDFDTET